MASYKDKIAVQSCTGSDRAVKESTKEIPDVADALFRQQTRLRETVLSLRERLHNVIREDKDAHCEGALSAARSAPLAIQLTEVGLIASQTEAILADILERLEL